MLLETLCVFPNSLFFPNSVDHIPAAFYYEGPCGPCTSK